VIAHIELTGQQIDASALSSDGGFRGPDDLPFAAESHFGMRIPYSKVIE